MNKAAPDWIHFFQSVKESIFDHWKNQALLSKNKSIIGKVEECGNILLSGVPHALILAPVEREQFIKQQAKVVSKMLEPPSISTFVSYCYLAKEVIFHEIQKLSFKKEDLLTFYNQISLILDEYILHTVHSTALAEDDTQYRTVNYDKTSHEERLTLLGQMTSSFVHEFRNPLTTIHGFIQLLRSDYPEIPYLEIIYDELEQLKFRVSQFLMLSRRNHNIETSLFSLNELLDQVCEFIYPKLLEANVDLQRTLSKELFINGHLEEIKQVVINIIFNAIDVLIENKSVPIIRMNASQKGDYVILEISNTGPKIPDHIAETIFQPFVTTKRSGTGLGLYICKEIVDKHQGSLLCHSTDEWTTFTMKVPAARKDHVD